MIFPEMSPAVARAVDMAMLQARAAGAPAVAGDHLVVGMLDEEGGRSAQLLTLAGLSFASFRNSLSKVSLSDSSGNEPSLPLTPVVERALATARDLAKEITGEAIVASEHLIVALVR